MKFKEEFIIPQGMDLTKISEFKNTIKSLVFKKALDSGFIKNNNNYTFRLEEVRYSETKSYTAYFFLLTIELEEFVHQ